MDGIEDTTSMVRTFMDGTEDATSMVRPGGEVMDRQRCHKDAAATGARRFHHGGVTMQI
jgi:hypothetical protein